MNNTFLRTLTKFHMLDLIIHLEKAEEKIAYLIWTSGFRDFFICMHVLICVCVCMCARVHMRMCVCFRWIDPGGLVGSRVDWSVIV